MEASKKLRKTLVKRRRECARQAGVEQVRDDASRKKVTKMANANGRAQSFNVRFHSPAQNEMPPASLGSNLNQLGGIDFSAALPQSFSWNKLGPPLVFGPSSSDEYLLRACSVGVDPVCSARKLSAALPQS